VVGLVLAAVGVLVGVAAFEMARADRRRAARHREVSDALATPAQRGPVLRALRENLTQLEAQRRSWLGERGRRLEAGEVRLAIALLLLADDRPEDALEMMAPIEPDRLPPHLQALLSMHAIDAHLRLGEWAEAERVLDGYPADGLNANGRALRANARAQIRLGREDARGALRCLDEIDPAPPDVRAELELTRARALAAEGRDAEQVERLLAAQPRVALELLLRRYGGEPAARVARRVLDRKGGSRPSR
jgi:hypothetical protein